MNSNTKFKKEKKEKKKRANFINIQLECFFFFFFFFSSKIKYIYNFFKPKSQTSKDSKRIITFTKSIMFDVNIKTVSYCHWIKNASLPSLVIAYSYGLRSNDTATLELGRCHWKVETKWHHFFLSVFEIGRYERLWTCVYKGVKVKRMNENANSFLCVRDRRSWNIEPNEINSSLKILNTKC